MDQYITGQVIRLLREQQQLTQHQLAEQLHVSDKAVSRWETGRGYPDIALLEPLGAALKTSVESLLNGRAVSNRNVSGNLLRSRLYVCPVCGNVIHASGEAAISCCGISLPPLEVDGADEEHTFIVEPVEDEYYITLEHPMTKEHYISLLLWITGDRMEMIRLYPEGAASARLKCRGAGRLYAFCNRHGLMRYTGKLR